MAWPRYEAPAGRCSTGATAGAKALMAWCLAFLVAARNLGIFNCRRVAGKVTLSKHGEGLAIDVGFTTVNGRANPIGWVLVRKLLPAVGRLGIQCIIWDRIIWSASAPAGTRYNGVHPHYDHVHIELTADAGRRLTLATCRAVLGTPSAPASSPPAGVHPLVELRRAIDAAKKVTLRRGSKGAHVKALQVLLHSKGATGLAIDGDFGELTEKVVRFVQGSSRLTVDGVVGPATWAALDAPTASPAPAPEHPLVTLRRAVDTAKRHTLRRGDRGAHVSALQMMLQRNGARQIVIDGQFGPTTETVVRFVQSIAKLKVDGVVGPATWAVIDR